MSRWICIHCHFYQPPRENPWLERIEHQESAHPFHDWNQRIAAECYAPNARSRVLDHDGWVTDIINNYEKISFNFGPTLLSWLEEFDPKTYQAILNGDQLSLKRFSGHGSAIAQAYNHVILPLAHRRDKETQVKWGIRDFEKRYKRYPESLWLPETAVDTETLEILAEHGMKYVILAPRQAKAVRALDEDGSWKNVADESVDPTQAYVIRLPSGLSIAAFFYDGPISRGVAFEGLLHNGETFAGRILDAFKEDSTSNQLAHIATDGETYGHHHLHGEMALSYALEHIEKENLARVTNYGEFLELTPPKMEAKIFENSSWSCVHGIERWRENCGCNSGSHPNWHQEWRKPLRKSFDFLRDRLESPYEEEVLQYTESPWEARNGYIELILDRSDESRNEFISKWSKKELTQKERNRFLKCMELQRQLLLMYTSCAWFFDEVSGIETTQNLKYAYRSIQLGEELFKIPLQEDYEKLLNEVPSNLPDLKNAKAVLDQYVKPSEVDLLRIGAHFAATAAIPVDRDESFKLPIYKIEPVDLHIHSVGRIQVSVGQVYLESKILEEGAKLNFSTIHFGDHNMNVGVRHFRCDESYMSLLSEVRASINGADLPEVIRVLDRHFGKNLFSLKDLFYDEQQRVLKQVFSQASTEIASSFMRIYDTYFALMCFLSDTRAELPKVFRNISEFVQNKGIKNALKQPYPDLESLNDYIHQSQIWKIQLQKEEIQLLFRKTISRMLDLYEINTENADALKEILKLIKTAKSLPFSIDYRSAQNRYFNWKTSILPQLINKEIKNLFLELGIELRVRSS
jgi:alpha-amylase/alpha-mannosidase (GH57 family)